ncbi:MAG: AMP-binding protein [Pseudomonadota bacterium]
MYALFENTAKRFAERPFLRAPAASTAAYADGAIEYSYAGARTAAEVLSGIYRSLDIGESARVAIAFDSRLDVYLHLLALNRIGASVVPLNLAGSDEEVRYVVDHSDARLVVCANEYKDRLSSIVESVRGVGVVPEADLPSFGNDARGEVAAGDDATEAAMLYTSGTTGKPKGCILSNEYFLTMGRAYGELGGLCSISESDRLLTPLPPNHMNALSTSFMAMLRCGGCVIQLDRFHPRSWWQTVREEKATVIHYLGVMPAILLTMGRQDDDFGGQIRFGFGAGSDPKHQRVFEERFGFPLIEAWAMTETGGGAMIVANREPRHVGKRCIGRPIPGTAYRVADKHGEAVSPGADGELLVRAEGDRPRAGFFTAYYKDEAATEHGWRGGWWHTGDIVREGSDGSLYFVDRSKNVIRRSGENIAAIEVETVLLRVDGIVNCAVTAVPDEMRGDEVFALVVTDGPTDEAAARGIFNSAMESMTYFKVPGYIAFVDELPLTGSQKVNRAAVKTLARASVEDESAFDLRPGKKRHRRAR